MKYILFGLFLLLSYIEVNAQCTAERITNSDLNRVSGSFAGWTLANSDVTSPSGGGINFVRDGQLNFLSQSITNVNPLGNTSPVFAIGVGPYDAILAVNSEAIVFEVSYAGTIYMRIRTTNGVTSGGAQIIYLNGASGNRTTVPMAGSPSNITGNINLTLPNNVPNAGSLSFRYDGQGTAPVDDIFLGYVRLTTTIVTSTPTISASGSTTFCTGESVTLTSSSAYDNQWYRNGTLISGATNQTYVANTSGTYTVIVTTNGCPSAASAGTTVATTACCNSGTAAPILSATTFSPATATIADLISLLSASNKPAGTNFTVHSSSVATDANKIATSTAVVQGNTYYVAFWDSSNNCYSPTRQITISIASNCSPDPYAVQQTWWLPYGLGSNPTSVVRIDFQTGVAVLNNPVSGTYGHGAAAGSIGFEGNTTVTNPLTGEFLFATDGNVIYKGSDGVKASGVGIGGHRSAEESAAVIPNPAGILGRDFIIFGNTALNAVTGTSGTAHHTGGLNAGYYNLETNTITGVTNLLTDDMTNGIAEALEVIPNANGTDYWIVVQGVDQYVKVYEYIAAGGFNPTPVSQVFVAATNPNALIDSFISWIPQQQNKIVITRQEKIGMADFNPATGVISNYQTKVTTSREFNGYSAALSPNGQYLY
ncbi:MAG: hypothetical protein EOP51_23880, partial [Sphingobacteriales bacterium]